jgi:hypothetical protein
MKLYLSLILMGALIVGASSTAFGESRKSENSANKAASNHRSRSTTHHQSSGSHHSTNSGSKTKSNVPSN